MAERKICLPYSKRKGEVPQADKSNIDQRKSMKMTDERLQLFHRTMVTDQLLTDKWKLMNSVSKNGRQMRYSTDGQPTNHLTCLIFSLASLT